MSVVGLAAARRTASVRLSGAWLGTSATNAAILLFGLATGVLSARLLAPEGRGALAAVLFWPHLITALGGLSLPAAMVFRRGRPDADRVALAATGAWLALGLSFIGALVGYLAVPFLLRDSAAGTLAQAYLLAFLPFNFLALALLALDQGDMRFGRYNLTRLLPSGVYLVGLLVLWALDAVSVTSLVWASWLGTALTAIVRLYHSPDALRARPSLSEARRLIAFGVRLHGAALIAVLLAAADRLVVITLWDDVSLGLYVVALTLATAGLNVVTGAFAVLLLPRLAEAKDPEAQRRIIIQGLTGTGDWRPRILAQGVALVTFAAVVWPLAQMLGLLGIPTGLLIANSAALAYLLVFLRRRLALSFRDCWGLRPTTVKSLWWHGRALMRGAGPVGANG